ncbi:MAG: energy transducer TonB [Bacteroidales bacterium]|nr:energy transducer TonB [Bacteroidales bacterium]
MKNIKDIFKKEDRAGLYITVIFHLTVIIVLLAYQIDSTIRKEESFVLDFSKQEEIERRQQEEIFKEDISKKLDELISAAQSSSQQVRNIATDASRAQLRDDRGTDAEELYKDAERLAKDLRNGQKDAIEENAVDETVEMQHQQKKSQENQKEYSGPSVLSYTLDGRKASHLPIPAYRCYGAGDVTVIITVDNSGRVVRAKVMDEISSSDNCLRSFAVRAARLSRFSASSDAPANQTGEIVYRFIAQ